MLLSQATALQSIFASLANKAQSQGMLNQYQNFMTLALKAQSNSRATLQTLLELKFPRTTAFVKQANITTGAQQVNNGVKPEPVGTHTQETEAEQSKQLLRGHAP